MSDAAIDELTASALTHRTAGGDWYYLPTDPEARNWRGPFHNDTLMRKDMERHFGSNTHTIYESYTSRAPSHLRAAGDEGWN
ncbi:MAG: hypothetical protein ACXWML_09840 [Candidatus Binataceae bacterium]